jgi:hypothetical protein
LVNRIHQRIIIRLQGRRGQPGQFCTILQRKKETHVSKYTNAAEVENRSRAKMLTLSGGRHDAKMLCHGLLSLGVLFVGVSQSFFSLLRLAKRSFLRLLSIRLSSSRNIISFSRGIELRL